MSDLPIKSNSSVSPTSAPDVAAPRSLPRPRQKSSSNLLGYVAWGILLNAAVFTLAFLYLKLSPRTYTSQWGVIVVGTNPGIDVTLPERGRTAPNPFSERPWIFQDPRSGYAYLATNSSVLEAAARLVDIPIEEFGKPIVNIDKESAVIAFEMKGATPKQSQAKSRALYQAMKDHINRLRRAELEDQQGETQRSLQAARDRLDRANSKLSTYQTKSLLLSEDQIRQLSTDIEQLYRQKAELISQDQGLKNRLQQLERDAQVSSKESTVSYALLADEVYKQQFIEYGRANAEYNNFASQLGPKHPQVLEKKAALQGASAALQQRGSLLLGRTTTLSELARIAPITLDPRVAATREGLYSDIVTSRAKQQEVAGTSQELQRQITVLEKRLKELSQQELVTDSIKRDLQISEALFTSSLAQVDSASNIDSIYPPMRLVAEPTLPTASQPTSPTLSFALLGGLAGSFLVTTALLLSWYEQHRPKDESALFDS